VTRFTLRPVRRADVAIVRRLVPLYLYELVGHRFGVEKDGSFASPAWHRGFWRRRGGHHYLMRLNGRPAGFALVRERANFAGDGVREISEFFVLRAYRRRGLGTRAARALLARFPGRWELAVLTWNPARAFWRRVVGRVAVGPVVTSRRRHDGLPFAVTHFETRRARRRGRGGAG
jgi:predicted acetyltransferase